jgi:hypothetical protein
MTRWEWRHTDAAGQSRTSPGTFDNAMACIVDAVREATGERHDWATSHMLWKRDLMESGWSFGERRE